MSIDPQIQEQLARVAQRERQVCAWRRVTMCWAASAAVGLLVLALERQSGWASSLTLPVVGVLGTAAAVLVWVKGRRQTDWRLTARRIEAQHPELQGRLVTAIQQQPAGDGQLNYLQQRLVLETLEHCRRSDWS